MACKQLMNRASSLGRCNQNKLMPLASMRWSSTRSDIEKVTHTGQARATALSCFHLRLRKQNLLLISVLL